MTPSIPLSLVGLLIVLLSPASSQTIDASVKDLSNKNADFAARLYRAVASRTDDNIFLSPLTVSAGLLALLSATNGPTQDQLLQGLTLTGLDPQTIPDVFQTLMNVSQENGKAYMQQGVAVLPSQSFTVSSSYRDLVQTKFEGNTQSLAYTSPFEAIDTINRWVEEQTGNRVRELVSTIDPQTQLLIATATSFQTQFRTTFNSSTTQDERFVVDKYHIVMVPMMFGSDKYFLAYDRSVKAGVLKLPMAGGAAMLVVLPDEDVDITSVEEEVTGEKVRGWIQQLKKTWRCSFLASSYSSLTL
uniref:Protein Z-dependent protease inhibitor-like n=1 Tax=Stegastes partitus TaxID=144197 RepID=A0A3B4Z5I8_9TELE